MKPEIDEIHRMYCNLSGMEIPLNIMRQFAWEHWLSNGFASADLALVIGNIRAGIKAKKRNLGALRFSNLIEATDVFEENLAEARAAQSLKIKSTRVPPRPSRAECLTPAGRNTAVPVSETALEILRKFRRENA